MSRRTQRDAINAATRVLARLDTATPESDIEARSAIEALRTILAEISSHVNRV